MALFSTRSPRRYSGVHIYTSERKDKLDKLVFGRFATLDLFFALGFCHKLVEFVLTL